MARYIDAELIEPFIHRDEWIMFVGIIDAIPTADVKPVVMGKWEPLDTTSTSRQCSACGFVFGDVRMITQSPGTTIIEHDYNFAFCPMCGADMRGENK